MQYKLSRYIIPSVISMVLVGTYTNIDGYFIGNAAGDDGLGAINIVWPIVAFITAIGTGIGIGGSVMLNNLRGSKNYAGAEQIKKTLIVVLAVFGGVLSLSLTAIHKPLLMIMGAEGRVLEYAENYSVIICAGAFFQVMGAGLLVLLRNENKTYMSMILSILGLIVHLVLDIMLVEKYKLYGVAVSTVTAQVIIMILGIVFLKIKKRTRIGWEYIPDMIRRATAPFGVNFVSSVVLLFTNYFSLKVGGTAAVSAYAVMSYAVYTFDYIFQGVCDGIQPIISYCCGSGDRGAEKHAMKCAAIILAVISAFCILITPILIRVMPGLFAVSGEAEKMIAIGFAIYGASYPFKAAVKYMCSYYYASGRTELSNILTYLDPLVLSPLLLIVLSRAFGINGIWAAMTLAQIVLSVIGVLIMYFKNISKSKKRQSVITDKNVQRKELSYR